MENCFFSLSLGVGVVIVHGILLFYMRFSQLDLILIIWYNDFILDELYPNTNETMTHKHTDMYICDSFVVNLGMETEIERNNWKIPSHFRTLHVNSYELKLNWTCRLLQFFILFLLLFLIVMLALCPFLSYYASIPILLRNVKIIRDNATLVLSTHSQILNVY